MQAVFFSIIFLLFSLSVGFAYGQENTESKPASEQESTEKKTTVPAPETDTPLEKTVNDTSIDRSKITFDLPTEQILLFKNDIKKLVNVGNFEPVLVGTDEVTVLFNQEKSSSAKGVAIIIPDWSQHLFNSKAINHLRSSLPLSGWNVFSIQPPEKPVLYPSQVEENEQKNKQNNELLADYKLHLTAVITAIMEKAANFPGIFLVIAEGANAAMLTEIYNEQYSIAPTAMVVLSGYMPEKDANDAFALTLAKVDLPILDLYLTKDNPWVLATNNLRKQLAKKHIKEIYRQKQLSALQPGDYPDSLSKEIIGWLKTIGW